MAHAGTPISVLTKRRATSKTAVLFTLCLAALIINIDVTIVNVALPSLVRQLGATTNRARSASTATAWGCGSSRKGAT